MEDRLKPHDTVSLNVSRKLRNSLETGSYVFFVLYNPTLLYRALFKVRVSFDQTQHIMTAAETRLDRILRQHGEVC